MEIESLLFIFLYAFFLAPFVVCLIVGVISVKAYKVSIWWAVGIALLFAVSTFGLSYTWQAVFSNVMDWLGFDQHSLRGIKLVVSQALILLVIAPLATWWTCKTWLRRTNM